MARTRITWLRDGLIIPNVGRTVKGRSAKVDEEIAADLIRQGIATKERVAKEETAPKKYKKVRA